MKSGMIPLPRRALTAKKVFVCNAIVRQQTKLLSTPLYVAGQHIRSIGHWLRESPLGKLLPKQRVPALASTAGFIHAEAEQNLPQVVELEAMLSHWPGWSFCHEIGILGVLAVLGFPQLEMVDSLEGELQLAGSGMPSGEKPLLNLTRRR